jgi:hypothetical protein
MTRETGPSTLLERSDESDHENSQLQEALMQPVLTEKTSWGTDLPRSGLWDTGLRVLVLDGDPTAVARATAELRGAGHLVERCCRPGPIPCHVFMTDPRCPLNQGGVDVALIARDHPWPGPPLERGSTCMLRAGISVALVDSVSERAAPACWRAVSRASHPGTVK